jgi:hypothetical protein
MDSKWICDFDTHIATCRELSCLMKIGDDDHDALRRIVGAIAWALISAGVRPS